MKRSAIICILATITFVLSACGQPQVISAVSDYEKYLEIINNEHNEEEILPPVIDDEQPVEDTQRPDVNGAEYVAGGFTYGSDFSGGYAFVQDAEHNFLLDADGNCSQSIRDLSDVAFYNGFFADASGNGFILSHIAAGAVSGKLYFDIEFGNNGLIICTSDSSYDVYDGARLTASVSKENGAPAFFVNGMLMYDGKICDEYLKQPVIGGFYRTGTIYDGMIMVRSESATGLLFGYADVDGNVVIAPQFIEADNFSSGYAVVRRADLKYAIVGRNGDLMKGVDGAELYFRTKPYTVYDNICVVENVSGGSTLYAENFMKELEFVPMNWRVYGKYAIDARNGCRLYDFAEDNYSQYYDLIFPYDDIFVTYDMVTGKYSVLDRNLKTIVKECDGVSYSGNMLRLEYSGRYFYYRIG